MRYKYYRIDPNTSEYLNDLFLTVDESSKRTDIVAASGNPAPPTKASNQYVLWNSWSWSLNDYQTINSTIDVTTVPADGTSAVSISGLPQPCQIVISGPGTDQVIEETSGNASFTFNLPGTYMLDITASFYLLKEYTIVAT